MFSNTEKSSIIKLVGHRNSILSIDSKGDHVVSGGEDFLLKVWDLKRKKETMFEDHMGAVTHAMIFDEHIISGGRDKKIIVRSFDKMKDLDE
jgi:WD40 repeat protein